MVNGDLQRRTDYDAACLARIAKNTTEKWDASLVFQAEQLLSQIMLGGNTIIAVCVLGSRSLLILGSINAIT